MTSSEQSSSVPYFDMPVSAQAFAPWPVVPNSYTDSNGVDFFRRAEDRGECTITEDDRAVFHFGIRGVADQNEIDFSMDEKVNNSRAMVDLEDTSVTCFSKVLPIQQSGQCSCLASMYLSMSALQELPNAVAPALNIVRNAASVARNTIHCPVCGVIVVTEPNPPAVGFQNTMLIGTILPLIVDGYSRMLKLVDEETARAAVTGQKMRFPLDHTGVFQI